MACRRVLAPHASATLFTRASRTCVAFISSSLRPVPFRSSDLFLEPTGDLLRAAGVNRAWAERLEPVFKEKCGALQGKWRLSEYNLKPQWRFLWRRRFVLLACRCCRQRIATLRCELTKESATRTSVKNTRALPMSSSADEENEAAGRAPSLNGDESSSSLVLRYRPRTEAREHEADDTNPRGQQSPRPPATPITRRSPRTLASLSDHDGGGANSESLRDWMLPFPEWMPHGEPPPRDRRSSTSTRATVEEGDMWAGRCQLFVTFCEVCARRRDVLNEMNAWCRISLV